MKNQYAKYKNPDGSKKNQESDLRKSLTGLLGVFRFSFFGGKNSKFTTTSKIKKSKRVQQKKSRVQRRVALAC